MRYSLNLFVALGLTLLALSANSALPQTDPDGNKLPSLSGMLKEVNPAVVNIATFSEQQMSSNPLLNDPFFRRFFNLPEQQQQPQNQQPQKMQRSAGSGVIIDAKKGIVVTNDHVIREADEVRVSLTDGRHYTAKILGKDPELDVAVLQIDADDLTEVKLGNAEILEVGDFVVAIGNPFGLGQTVTTGIVSALGRTGLGIEGYENFIQTDASINPGNSGGALVNLNGELVGINTAIIAPAGGNVGIGFAIPMDMVKSSVDQIMESGEVKRGQLGIGIQDITVDLQIAFDLENGQQGVLVTHVTEDSEADKAGLKVDDIIIAVDGDKTVSTGNLRSQISKKKIGESVALTLLRDGKRKTIDVGIGEPVQQLASNGRLHPLLDGARFENNTEGKGVVVVDLPRNSAAAFSGLRPGDVIVGANKRRVEDLDDFRDALRRDNNRILLRVERGRSAFYLVIQ